MTARLKSDAFAAVSRFLFLLMNLSWDLSKKKREKRTCSGHTWFRDVERFVFLFSMSSVDKLQRGGVCVCVAMC